MNTKRPLPRAQRPTVIPESAKEIHDLAPLSAATVEDMRQKGEEIERKRLADRLKRTNGGYLVAGVLLPFTYSAANQIDPIAEKTLEGAFDHPEVDAEILAFHQHGYRIVISGSEAVNATMSGTYLVYEGHPESDSYVVYFIKISGIDRVYIGAADTPILDMNRERRIDLSEFMPEDRQKVLQTITQTFQWAHELR